MSPLFQVFIIFKSISFGWTYWFGNRDSMTSSEREDVAMIFTSFIIYFPFIILMFLIKGVSLLFSGKKVPEEQTLLPQSSMVLPTDNKQPLKDNISLQETSRFECPICHHPVTQAQKFCTNCGHKLINN